MKKKIIALLLSVCMLASMAVVPAAAAGAKDVPEGHWAKDAVDRWVKDGIMEVDGDGNFRLAEKVTRAKFAIMLCKLMGYTDKADKSAFKDLPADSEAADALLKLAQAGVMAGDGQGNSMPDQPIDRQQMAVMLCAAFNLKTASSNATASYQDAGSVASWAQAAVSTLVDKKMMVGDGKNLMPDTSIANGDMAALLNAMIADFVTEDGATVNTGDKNGVVIINAKDVKVENAPDSAGIVVAPGAGSTTVTVTGAASDITVAAEGAKVTVGKDAEVGSVTVDAPKAAVTVNGTAGDVAVTEAAESAKVTVAKDAEVGTVAVEAPKTAVSVSGTVASVAVAQGADNTTVSTTTGAKIDSVTTSADKVTVTGAANTVGSVVADAGSANVAVKGAEVTNNGADKVTAGSKPVETGKTDTVATTPSTGGSSGGGSYVPDPDPSTPVTPPAETADVVNAPIADHGSPAITDLGSVAVTGTTSDGGKTVNVTVKGTNIVKHENANHTKGFWVGFGMPIEDGKTYVYTSGASSDPITSIPGRVIDGEGGKKYNTVYFDDEGSYTIKQYTDSVADTNLVATYSVTVTMTKAVTDVKSTLAVAPLADHAESNAITDSSKLGTVTIESATTSDGGRTIDVVLKGENIMKHANANKTEGHWVGFGMPVDNEGTYSYSVKSGTGDYKDVATIASREYTDNNGKKYNTVYFSEETNGTYLNYSIKQCKGENKQLVATYNVTCNVTFWKPTANQVTVRAFGQDEIQSYNAGFQKAANAVSMTKFGKSAVDSKDTYASTFTFAAEKGLSDLVHNENSGAGAVGYYTYYAIVVSNADGEVVKSLHETHTGSLGFPMNADSNSIDAIIATRIFDGETSPGKIESITHNYQLKDKAGRVQYEFDVAITNNCTVTTVEITG